MDERAQTRVKIGNWTSDSKKESTKLGKSSLESSTISNNTSHHFVTKHFLRTYTQPSSVAWAGNLFTCAF